MSSTTVTARIEVDSELLKPVHNPNDSLDVRDLNSIRSSPYHDKEHWLDLTKVTDSNRALALALQSFEPRNNKYAVEKYEEAFNLEQIVVLAKKYASQLGINFEKTTLYVIAFRSILKPEIQESAEKRRFLAKVDEESHREANESGGLLKYWFGTPDDVHGQNLATCLWESRQQAKAGGGGRAHREGMHAVRTWYKHWKVEEYELTVESGAVSYTFSQIK